MNLSRFRLHGNEIYASVMEYSDIRKIIREKEYIVPTKIWNKDVVNIDFIYGIHFPYPNLKIIIPSSTIFNKLSDMDEDFRYSILYGVNTGNNEIEIQDNTGKCYMDNFILFDKNQTEAYLFVPWKSGDIYIPATIKKIYSERFFKLKNSNIIIDDNNPYYYVYDNAVYTKPGVLEKNDVAILGMKFNKGELDCSQLCVPIRDWSLGILREYRFDLKLPPNFEGSLLIIGIKNVVIIPKELKNANLLMFNASDYEIEEGNDFYVVENGGLLVKDEMKLISISDSAYRDDGIYIGDTVRKVDERLIERMKETTFNVSPDNPYIEKIENGIITYKNNVNN